MTAKRAVMKWDAEAHEDMLLCIFKHCNLGSENMAKVLADMHAKGYTFTENAFRYEPILKPLPWGFPFFPPVLFIFNPFAFSICSPRIENVLYDWLPENRHLTSYLHLTLPSFDFCIFPLTSPTCNHKTALIYRSTQLPVTTHFKSHNPIPLAIKPRQSTIYLYATPFCQYGREILTPLGRSRTRGAAARSFGRIQARQGIDYCSRGKNATEGIQLHFSRSQVEYTPAPIISFYPNRYTCLAYTKYCSILTMQLTVSLLHLLVSIFKNSERLAETPPTMKREAAAPSLRLLASPLLLVPTPRPHASALLQQRSESLSGMKTPMSSLLTSLTTKMMQTSRRSKFPAM